MNSRLPVTAACVAMAACAPKQDAVDVPELGRVVLSESEPESELLREDVPEPEPEPEAELVREDVSEPIAAEPIDYVLEPPPEPEPYDSAAPVTYVGNHSARVSAPGTSRPSNLRRRPRLLSAHIDCPFPPEADAESIVHASVVLRVDVEASGAVRRIRILHEPGYGFGRAASACIQEKRFVPAEDAQGNPVASNVPVRVVFTR